MSDQDTTTDVVSVELRLASEQVAGLRALADMIEQNPEVAPLAVYLKSLDVFTSRTAEDHALLARLALRHGAKVDKSISDKQYNLNLSFAGGAVLARSLAWREEVCERVVVGKDTVTTTVPDPVLLASVPLVEVTEEVETVEWVCRPLLAAGASGSDGEL